MFDRSSLERHKKELPIDLVIAGEAPLSGAIFVANGERLTAVLNDQRAFIPFRENGGAIRIVAKTTIVSVRDRSNTVHGDDADPSERFETITHTRRAGDNPAGRDSAGEKTVGGDARADAGRGFDPYAFLGVHPEASLEDIKSIYKSKMKAVHPDAVAASGGDEAQARAALLATQKLNHAYRKILHERKADPQQSDASS